MMRACGATSLVSLLFCAVSSSMAPVAAVGQGVTRVEPVPRRPAPSGLPRGTPSDRLAPQGVGSAPEDIHGAYTDLKRLYAGVSPSVVKVVCRCGRAQGTGTGFFLSADGLVVTNWHVVAEPRVSGLEIVLAKGTTLKANVLAFDKEADLAILQPAKPTTVADVLTGVTASEIKVGQWAVSIGYPNNLRLSFSRGVVSGVRTAKEVSEAMGRGAPDLRHAYRYVQTDASIYYGNSGGPLVDEKGRVLGVCTLRIPDSRIGFAVEWKAVTDLVAKARKARPVSLDTLRKESAGRPRMPFLGSPTTGHHVGKAVLELQKALYCYKCSGTGRIEETRYRMEYESQPVLKRIGKRLVKRYERVRVKKGYKVRVICPVCHGRRLSQQHDRLYKRLCTLTDAMFRLDPHSYRAEVTWREAGGLLDEIACDQHAFGQELNRRASGVLGMPQKYVGETTAFVGQIHAVFQAPDYSLLLVRLYASSQFVIVACRTHVSALRGQYCLVAGMVAAAGRTSPAVLAIAVNAVHPVDPRYRAKHALPDMPMLKRVEASRPPEAALPDKPSPDAPEAEAEKLLQLAENFLGNKLRSLAKKRLEKLLESYPNTAAGKKGRKLYEKTFGAYTPEADR